MMKQRSTTPRALKGAEAFVPPYPPSWFDRFTTWIDGLPGPAWVFYLILGVAVGLAQSALQWGQGAYPAGTFNPGHFWTAANFVYLLALTHYLDKSAAAALVSFRPLLTSADDRPPSARDQSLYSRLAYQLTTLPARTTFFVTVVGILFAVLVFGLQLSAGPTPAVLAGIAGTAFSYASVMTLLIIENAITGVFVYHTIHQLVLISRIYTQYARINIYQLQPLYALSFPGASTAIGIMLYVYVWFATSGSASQAVGPVELGLTVSLAAIAAATFAWPLLGAHRRLVAEKNMRLTEVSTRFEAAAAQLLRDLDDRRLTQMDQLNKALASLEILQIDLRKIPTWPWQPGAVRGLLAALFLPLAIWAIQLLLDRVL